MRFTIICLPRACQIKLNYKVCHYSNLNIVVKVTDKNSFGLRIKEVRASCSMHVYIEAMGMITQLGRLYVKNLTSK